MRSSARPPQGSCGGLAEVLRRSCGGPCGGLAEFIEILRRPPQDFKLLHYVVIGPRVTFSAKKYIIVHSDIGEPFYINVFLS